MIRHIEMVNVIKLNATNIKYVYYHNKNNIESCIMDPNNLEEEHRSRLPHETINSSSSSSSLDNEVVLRQRRRRRQHHWTQLSFSVTCLFWMISSHNRPGIIANIGMPVHGTSCSPELTKRELWVVIRRSPDLFRGFQSPPASCKWII